MKTPDLNVILMIASVVMIAAICWLISLAGFDLTRALLLLTNCLLIGANAINLQVKRGMRDLKTRIDGPQ